MWKKGRIKGSSVQLTFPVFILISMFVAIMFVGGSGYSLNLFDIGVQAMADGSNVNRSVDRMVTYCNQPTFISLDANIYGNWTYYLMEEYVPAPFSINDNGSFVAHTVAVPANAYDDGMNGLNNSGWTNQTNILKWIYFNDTVIAPNATFTYGVESPCVSGKYEFDGTYQIENMSSNESTEGHAFVYVLSNFSAGESGMERFFNTSTAVCNESIEVELTVLIQGNWTYFLIEEYVPSAFNITDYGSFTAYTDHVNAYDDGMNGLNNSGWTNQTNILKWVYFNDTVVAPNITFTYVVEAPCTNGNYTFDGTYQIENMSANTSTGGYENIEVTGGSSGVCTPGDIDPCGSGTCAGNTTCDGTGNWGACTTNAADCGTCCICESNDDPAPSYDETQDSDCASYDCDQYDTSCTNYTDVQYCKAIGDCADAQADCTSSSFMANTVVCSSSLYCSNTGGGDDAYNTANYMMPSVGFCDGAGSCDYANTSAASCDLAEGTATEGTGQTICVDGSATCVDTCTDTLDNDNDGLNDSADPDCFTSAANSSIYRQFNSSAAVCNATVNVSLRVYIQDNSTYFLIEEYVPSAFEIINNGSFDAHSTHPTAYANGMNGLNYSGWTNQTNVLKWIYFNDTVVAPNITFWYEVKAPCLNGVYEFDGTYQIENMSENVTTMGSTTVVIAGSNVSGICTPGNSTACGSGNCTGTTTCQANATWSVCSTYNSVCDATYLCSNTAGGDDAFNVIDFTMPSKGYCDINGSCDMAATAASCDLAEGAATEGTGQTICVDGSASCVDTCSDTLDNDANGCTDSVDASCGGVETNCSDNIDNDCDGLQDMNDSDCFVCSVGNVTTCGSGACAGTTTCGITGQWGPCTTNGADCGTCCICESNDNPSPTFAQQPADCSSYDCDQYDTSCEDFTDVQYCTGLGTCASAQGDCNDSSYMANTVVCSSDFYCSNTGGGDDAYNVSDFTMPSVGFCDGAGSCDYANTTTASCDVAQGGSGEGTGQTICADGFAVCQDTCNDGLDNDADTCQDGADVDCGGTESLCSNGNDDDCDGLEDMNDPDCVTSVDNSSIYRSFNSSAAQENDTINVSLRVFIHENWTYFLIEEYVPAEFEITNYGSFDVHSSHPTAYDNGMNGLNYSGWTNQTNVLKWIYFNDTVVAPNITFWYEVRAPSTIGIYSFDGTYQIENMSVNITTLGATNVTVSSGNVSPTCSPGANQSCGAGNCTGISICQANSTWSPCSTYQAVCDATYLCSNTGGGDDAFNVVDFMMPSKGYCDINGSCDMAATGVSSCSLAEDNMTEGSGLSICVDGQAACVNTCGDGLDNDNDTIFDLDDADCGGTENDCSDGIDNDGDGVIDGNDTDCNITRKVNLISPADAATSSSSSVSFRYNTTENMTNCSIIIDGTLVATTENVTMDTTQTIARTLSNAAYTWRISCYNLSGSAHNSLQRSLTVSHTTSSSSGSSGGGGGGGSGGGSGFPTSSTTKSKSWFSLQAGQWLEWNISDFTIVYVKARVKENTQNARLAITALEELPANIVQLPNVLEYIEFAHENLDVESVTIKFRVDNGDTVNKDILMSRYTNRWVNLGTLYDSRDGEYTYYRANSPGLSYFGIKGETTTTVVEPESETNETEVILEPEPETNGTGDIPDESDEVDENSRVWIYVLLIILILIFVGAAVVVQRYKARDQPLFKPSAQQVPSEPQKPAAPEQPKPVVPEQKPVSVVPEPKSEPTPEPKPEPVPEQKSEPAQPKEEMPPYEPPKTPPVVPETPEEPGDETDKLIDEVNKITDEINNVLGDDKSPPYKP